MADYTTSYPAPDEAAFEGYNTGRQPSPPPQMIASVGSPEFNSLFESLTQGSDYTAAMLAQQDVQHQPQYQQIATQFQQQQQSSPRYNTAITDQSGSAMASMAMQKAVSGSFESSAGYRAHKELASSMGMNDGGASASNQDPQYLAYSNGSPSHPMHLTNGLRIHPDHFQQPMQSLGPQQQQQQQAQPGMYLASAYHTEQPTPGTVSALEEAALQQTAPYSRHLQQSQASVPGRQSRRSTLSESVGNIASLSLNSPRHSVSSRSSVSSSAQTSPTTPASAYGLDSSHFGQQQQNHLWQQQHQQGHLQMQQNMQMQQQQQQQQQAPHLQNAYSYQHHPLSQSVGPGKQVPQMQYGQEQLYQLQLDPAYSTGLPSFQQQQMQPQYAYPQQYQQQQPMSAPATHSASTSSAMSHSLSHSLSRRSRPGLMDDVVSSRKAVVSPKPTSIDAFEAAADGSLSGKEGQSRSKGRRHRSNTGASGSSPPLTPSRSVALRASRGAGLPASQSTPDSLSTPTGTPGPAGVAAQTPSRAGPHRTPGKSGTAAASATGLTPKRPDLRRTASATPHMVRKPSVTTPGSVQAAAGGMTLDTKRAQQLQQAQLSSSVSGGGSSAQLTRSIAGIELDFPASPVGTGFGTSVGSSGMARATSSPGWALSAAPRPRSSGETSSASVSTASGGGNGGNSSGDRSRRSSTVLSLQMSPLPHSAGAEPLYSSGPLSAPPTTMSSSIISPQHALQALETLSTFLAAEAAALYRSPPQSRETVLGTQEQTYAIDDLKLRVQHRLATLAVSSG